MMGLLDKIRKKKETGGDEITPAGKPVIAKSEEEFLETCRGLTKDFMGIMFLSGDIDGELYSASLIVDRGDVKGSTFEFKGLITFKEQAIDEIKNRLKGSSGNLHIFEFDEGDMNLVREENKSALLGNPIPLSSLGMKIKFLMEKWAKEREAGGGGIAPIKIPELFKIERNFNLLELARSPEKIQDIGKEDLYEKMKPDEVEVGDMGDLLGAMGGVLGDRKMEELRRIREERERKIAERLAKVKRKEPPKKVIHEGEKVKTTIDRLYSLVKKYEKLRIDDKLAHTLGVNKTQIEEWAVILEEHDLLELHYPTIGEPEIRIVRGDKEKS